MQVLKDKAELLDQIMVAFPHRSPHCNSLDQFVDRMVGFKQRYQQLLDQFPLDRQHELFHGVGVVEHSDGLSQLTTAQAEDIQLLSDAEDIATHEVVVTPVPETYSLNESTAGSLKVLSHEDHMAEHGISIPPVPQAPSSAEVSDR